MSAPLPPGTHPADVIAALWARILATTGDLAEADWRRPTPCPGWDVKDLAGHLGGTQTAFDGTAAQPAPPEGWAPPEGSSELDGWTEAAVAARRDWSVAQVADELQTAARGHEARLRAVTGWEAETYGPTGRTTELGLFAVRCYDLWVHLQDMHAALGREVESGDDSPAAVVAHGWVLERVPWLYAKRVGAPEGAALRLTLTDPIGTSRVLVRRDGRARFDDDADPGAELVAAAPAALTLLVSGRDDERSWSERGLLHWDGAGGEAFVRRARLF